MKTKLIEVTNGFNHGKFILGQMDEEMDWPSAIEGPGFFRRRWSERHIWVLDVETGEGALFLHGGLAEYDLNRKHRVWVCPMFEPFLCWLYEQDVSDLDALPPVVELSEAEAPSSLRGYRRDARCVAIVEAGSRDPIGCVIHPDGGDVCEVNP